MPSELEPAFRASVPRVATSGVMELNFALFIVECLLQPPAYRRYECVPWANAALGSRQDLLERVAAFWGDGHNEWSETLILAHRGGMLFDESPEGFIAHIDDLLALPGEVPPLPSEPPGVREILAARIARLQESPELRRDYARLLGDIWDALAPAWREEGLPIVRQRAGRIEQQLAGGADPRTLLPRHHFVFRERHAPGFQAALEHGEAVFVPLALAGAGAAYFALPGATLVAFGPDAGTGGAAHRQAMEAAAARFKVLSDPTRLSILDHLSYDEHTITDLARALGVSQPTVSVHVKALREGGLVEALREDGRTVYRASPERTREFVESTLAEMSR